MKIDEIWYLNLDEAIQRKAAMEAIFAAQEVPQEIVKRYRADSINDFSSENEMYNYFIKEGFPCITKNNFPGHRIAPLVNFNHFRVLKEIAEGTKNILFLHDDTLLMEKWCLIEKELEKIKEPIDILWFHSSWRDYETELVELQVKAMEQRVFKQQIGTRKLYNNFCGHSERARVFTPKGANLFLKWAQLEYVNIPEQQPEMLPWRIYHQKTNSLALDTCQTFYTVEPDYCCDIKDTGWYIGPATYVWID